MFVNNFLQLDLDVNCCGLGFGVNRHTGGYASFFRISTIAVSQELKCT